VTEVEMLQVLLSTQIQSIEKEIAIRDDNYNKQFNANIEAVKVAMNAAEKATVKAENAMDKRLDSMNEFRGTLSDQQKTYLTKSEYAIQHQALIDKTEGLDKAFDDRHKELITRVTRMEGTKTGINQIVPWIFAIIGVLFGLFEMFYK
jgi:DNA-binding FrmR family transcriptional regulator